MSKRWFAPRLLGLHALAIAAIVVCTLMGLWQLGVYGSKHDDAAKSAQSSKPVDLLKVWGPDDPFTEDLLNRRVRIDGSYPKIVTKNLKASIAELQFIVTRPDGQKWIATTVRVQGTDASIIVVLGHVPPYMMADLYLPHPPLTAILQPPESTGDLSIARRVNLTHGDLFSGYALLEAPSSSVVKPVLPPDPDVPWTVGLRNLAYALQWWVFGLFSAFMWWRMATDALEVDESVSDPQVT